MLTYVVGDIHGCIGLLRRALEVVNIHSKRRAHQLVCLGDYIDRGPDSKAVIDLLMTHRNEGRVVCLLGNHERMLLDLVRTRSPRAAATWIADGGSQTLRSYGLDPFDPDFGPALPETHVQWLARRPIVYPTFDRIFVHAGIDPSKSLMDQGEPEFLWIRTPFLKASASDFVERRHIVHGHTPLWAGKREAGAPEVLPHRTNLDTGAYVTGILVIGVFQTDVSGPVDLLPVRL